MDCPFNTTINTPGIGDAVPAGINTLGSGDRFDLGPSRPGKRKGKKRPLIAVKAPALPGNLPLIVWTKKKK